MHADEINRAYSPSMLRSIRHTTQTLEPTHRLKRAVSGVPTVVVGYNGKLGTLKTLA